MKVAVGLSGGVDSSVSAWKLKEAGYEVHGVFMRNWHGQEEECSALQDMEDAASVAAHLGISFEVIDLSESYWNKVFSFFLSEIEKGRTPSPDILCNQHVKFGALFERLIDQGHVDYIATGHYAGLNPQHQLIKAADERKDQTYFLWSVDPQRWSKVLFPLSSLQKEEVRQIAEKIGLKTARKKDSTGICFIGPKNFRHFLSQYFIPKKGPILSDSGLYLGDHYGLFAYTLGQRSGLHIGGVKGAAESPWYVIEKDLPTNTLIISQNANHPLLLKSSLTAHGCVWSSDIHQDTFSALSLEARIRHGQKLTPCSVEVLDKTQRTVLVRFEEPQRAITAGQAVVIYHQERCLGGGWIE